MWNRVEVFFVWQQKKRKEQKEESMWSSRLWRRKRKKSYETLWKIWVGTAVKYGKKYKRDTSILINISIATRRHETKQ